VNIYLVIKVEGGLISSVSVYEHPLDAQQAADAEMRSLEPEMDDVRVFHLDVKNRRCDEYYCAPSGR